MILVKGFGRPNRDIRVAPSMPSPPSGPPSRQRCPRRSVAAQGHRRERTPGASDPVDRPGKPPRDGRLGRRPTARALRPGEVPPTGTRTPMRRAALASPALASPALALRALVLSALLLAACSGAPPPADPGATGPY